MTDTPQSINVAGAGVAELPVPAWAWLLKAAAPAAVACATLATAFRINGWHWITQGSVAELAGFCAVSATLATAAALVLARSGLLNRWLNLRRSASSAASKGKWVYGGSHGARGPLTAALFVVGLAGLAAYGVSWSIRSCPLPGSFSKINYEILSPRPDESLVPVYFWDYATWVDPAWFEDINLVVPYEKGPPQKLLPKLYFEDARTHRLELELHGRRPRSYPQSDVYSVFESLLVHPRDWPLVWKLEREAGLTPDPEATPTLYLIRVHRDSVTTQAIGVPWEAAGAPPSDSIAKASAGRVFFWGPDGSVFQARCARPCRMARTLELVQFPGDPRGSFNERLGWTRMTLRKLLEEASSAPANAAERRRRENLMTVYLASLLTLDPRDPEAFFHLGKLARNRETALSAVRYGRDLGLEPAKIAELESVLDTIQ